MLTICTLTDPVNRSVRMLNEGVLLTFVICNHMFRVHMKVFSLIIYFQLSIKVRFYEERAKSIGAYTIIGVDFG